MVRTIAALWRNETDKVLRSKFPYLGIAAVCLVCLVIFLFTRTSHHSQHLNGWAYVGFAMQGGFADVGLIFITIFCALLIAEETGSGTVRLILASPVRRAEFYTAKVLTGLQYMLLMFTVALVVSLVIGAVRYRYGVIADSAGVIYGRKLVVLNLLLTCLLSLFPLSAAVMFGIFISVIIRKSGQAIGLAIGLLILIETTKSLIHFEPYVYTTYLGSAWIVFHEVTQGVDYQWFPTAWQMLIVSAISSVVLFTGGLIIFSRRDLNG